MFETIHHNSHYVKRYQSFMESRQGIKTEGVEKHHIIPKSLGGNNEQDNIIYLTYREHFIAHLILSKCFYGKIKTKMLYAFNMMMTKSSKHQRGLKNSRYYESKRKEWFTHTKGKHSHLYGKKLSNETKQKMKNAWTPERKQLYAERLANDPILRNKLKKHITPKQLELKLYQHRKKSPKCTMLGKTHTAETKQKISQSHKGRIKSETHKKKLSEARINLNFQHSEETKKKISEASKNNPRYLKLYTCPHCQKQGKGGNMTRYHFDKCKSFSYPNL